MAIVIMQYKDGEGTALPGGESENLLTGPLLAGVPTGITNWTPWGMEFNQGGTKVYVIGYEVDGADQTYTFEYDLSTPWDVTTLSYNGKYYESTAQDQWGSGIAFRPNGLQMYIAGGNTGAVYQYDLSVAWDISTASYLTSYTTTENIPQTVAFKEDDGARMYITGHLGNEVSEYTLGTNWDVSTATHLNTTSSLVSAEVSQTSSMAFRPDGSIMYVIGYGNDTVAQFPMVASWVTSTAANPSITYDVSSEEIGPTGFAIRSGGQNMYVVGTQQKKIIQYALGTDWDVSTANPA